MGFLRPLRVCDSLPSSYFAILVILTPLKTCINSLIKCQMAMAYKGLPLLGTYWVYEPHVYNLGNHLVIQSRMSRTSTFWLACTKYRLVPYSPALVWFKNTRFNIHNATKFTTLGTFQGHFSFLRRNYPGKPFCTALLSFAPAYLGYDRYVHNHICVFTCNYPLLYRSR